MEEMKDFEYNQSTFKRVNNLFGGWELKGLPQQKWKKFDPRDDLEETERRAKDLQGCLGLVLSGHFDESHPHYAEAINRMKDIFVDLKFNENKSAKEMEDTLKWWKMHANSYDPLNASEEDVVMFRKNKGLLAQFGFKEGDPLDTRNKEIQEALALWTKNKGNASRSTRPLCC
jgi:hypothetical protein